MKRFQPFLLAILAAALMAGCQSADAESTDKMGSADTKAATEGSGSGAMTAEKAKCEGCGNEVDKAELVSHDGKMLCKACMSAHQHG